MNKSNYDKASKVAMDKLMPKRDVSITISMKGGGGLSSLQRMPIVYRDNGGGLFGFTEDDVETFDTWEGGSDILNTGFYNVPGRARTKVVANQQVPIGFNLAAGRDTTGMLAGGTERPFRESDDPGIYSISTPERSENRKAQLDKAREILGRADEEVRRTEAENALENEVANMPSFFLGKNFGQGGGYDLNISPFSFASPDSDYYGWSENIPTYSGVGGLFDLVSDDPYREVEGGDYGKWTENIPTADDLFVDDEEYQLMGQRPEQKEKITEVKEYLDKINKKSQVKFGKTWKAAKEIVNNPAQAKFTLSNIIRWRDSAVPTIGNVPIPDSFVKIAQSWNQTRADLENIRDKEGAPDSVKVKKAKGGGLSSMSPRMNIGGKPYRLSYIDPRQAKVGGPVIRRQFGGDVDMYGEATPDMDYTEDDFTPASYHSDVPGSLLTDTEDAQAGLISSPKGPMGFEQEMAFGIDPSARPDIIPFKQDPNAPLNRPTDQGGNLTPTRPVDDGSKKDFMGRTKDQSAWDQTFTDLLNSGMSWAEANRAMAEGISVPGGIESIRNYGGAAGLLNARKQALLNQLQLKRIFEEDKTRKGLKSDYQLEEDSITSKIKDTISNFISPEGLTPEGTRELNEQLGGTGTFYPISMADKMVEGAVKLGLPGPLGAITTLGGFLMGGRPVGIIRMNDGKSYYVGEDGQLSDMEIAEGPNLGNESTSKGTQARTVATTQDVAKETPKEGLDKVLAERKTPSKRGDSLASLRAIIENIYPTGGRVTPPTIV